MGLTIPTTVNDPRTQQALDAISNSFPLARGQIGKEAVGPTNLSTSAKELFPQLTTAAARKINFGETTVTWTASVESAIKEVEHGLGVKPIFVGLTIESATGATLIQLQTTERTTSKFKVFGKASAAITATLTVMWIAIG